MRENKDIAEIIICSVPFVIVAKKYRKTGYFGQRSKMNVKHGISKSNKRQGE